MQYYIIQVTTGQEQIFINNLKKLNPELVLSHNFIYLTRELTIRRGGKWLKKLQPVFPSFSIFWGLARKSGLLWFILMRMNALL